MYVVNERINLLSHTESMPPFFIGDSCVQDCDAVMEMRPLSDVVFPNEKMTNLLMFPP